MSLDLNKYEFQQKLAKFAQQQLVCEYDCGQKIVRVNIRAFIATLYAEAKLFNAPTEEEIIALKEKWGISLNAEYILCDIPTPHSFSNANILPLQLELHHHFSLIINATKKYFNTVNNASAAVTGDTLSLYKTLRNAPQQLLNTSHYMARTLLSAVHLSDTPSTTNNNNASSTSDNNTNDSSKITPIPVDYASKIDTIYQNMMIEINLTIFEEIRKFLAAETRKDIDLTLMKHYIAYIRTHDAVSFYNAVQQLNHHYESIIKDFLIYTHKNTASASHALSTLNLASMAAFVRTGTESSGHRGSTDTPVSRLNQKFDELRTEIAKKYYVYYLNALAKAGVSLNKVMIEGIEALLPQTPADLYDKLIQNGTTGTIGYVTATEFTAHCKKYNSFAIRQVMVSHLAIPLDVLFYRVPSLPATDEDDAKKIHHKIANNKEVDESFYVDASYKLTQIQTKIARDLLHQAGKVLTEDDVIYYNLLTSYGSTLSIETTMLDDEKKNHQNWSTEITIEGLHRKNSFGLKNKAPLFLLCNLGVNGFGIGSTGVRGRLHGNPNGIKNYLAYDGDPQTTAAAPVPQRMTNEILALAELSILNLLAKKVSKSLPCYPTLLNSANVAVGSYRTYLRAREPNTLFSEFTSQNSLGSYSTNKMAMDDAKDSVRKFFSKLNTTTDIENELTSLNYHEKTQYLLSLAIAKIFAFNHHLSANNGMLIQSLLVALQDLTVAGCKSASERFANVQGLAEAAYHPNFRQKLLDFISTPLTEKLYDKEENDSRNAVNVLYDSLATIFNDSVYQNAGLIVSNSCQGSGPKTDIDEKTLLSSVNTNKIVNENVDNLKQTEAEELQAHKVEKHHSLVRAFKEYQTEQTHLTAILSDMQQQNDIIKEKARGAAGNHITSDFVNRLNTFNTFLQNAFPEAAATAIALSAVSESRNATEIDADIRQHPAIIYEAAIDFSTFLNPRAHYNTLTDFYGTSVIQKTRTNINQLIRLLNEKFPHYHGLCNDPATALGDIKESSVLVPVKK